LSETTPAEDNARNGSGGRASRDGDRVQAVRRAQCAADLGLSDELADGPRTVAELAASVSADEDSLRRLLHALATLGVYDDRRIEVPPWTMAS
jgi:hypothetical protein